MTLCAQNQELLFDPDPVREMIQQWWDKLHGKFTYVQTDAFVIMPNHIHGIIVLGLGEGDNRDSGEHAQNRTKTRGWADTWVWIWADTWVRPDVWKQVGGNQVVGRHVGLPRQKCR